VRADLRPTFQARTPLARNARGRVVVDLRLAFRAREGWRMAEMFPCSKRERVGVVDDPRSRVSSEGGMADGRNVPSLETRDGG